MLRLPLFFQRALPSLVVTKARNCHRVRQRRCSYRFQVPYARQKRKTNKISDMSGMIELLYVSQNAKRMSATGAFYMKRNILPEKRYLG